MYGGVKRLNDLNREDEQVLAGNIIIYRSSHLDFNAVSQALGEFRQLHPAVTYSINATQCADVVRALQQRVASIGFCTQPGTLPQIERHKMQSQQFAFYCGTPHPLYQRQDLTLDMLANTHVVGFDGETLTGALSQIARWRVRHELGDNLIVATSSVFDLVDMIEQMPVIGAMSTNHAARHAGELWQLPLADTPISVDMFALIDTDRHLSPAERAFF